MHLFELTRQLMAISSVTGAERSIAEYLAAHLSALGYRIERQRVTPDRFNVLAFAGDPRVVFCTHIDTVPSQLDISEDASCLYGRGACDAKGILAAMVEAGDRLKKDGVTSFAFLLVVGEEVDGIGAKFANQLEWNSRFVIVGEPTGNRLARAQKGTLMANLTVSGKAAHSGYPEAGISAIHNLLAILGDCLNSDWGEDPVLGRGSFNVGVIEGGEKANIIAPNAMASVMLRTVQSRQESESLLRTRIAGRADVEIVAGADPQMMHVVDDLPSEVVSFGSDVPHLTRLGKPVLVGPGSILDAHTAHEKIRKNDLMDGVELYYGLAKRLIQ